MATNNYTLTGINNMTARGMVHTFVLYFPNLASTDDSTTVALDLSDYFVNKNIRNIKSIWIDNLPNAALTFSLINTALQSIPMDPGSIAQGPFFLTPDGRLNLFVQAAGSGSAKIVFILSESDLGPFVEFAP